LAKSVLVALRLPIQLKTKIDQLVTSGRYRNFSEAVRTALQQFLAEYEKA
jgi:Arc/MetJ-type ribon-helix-helix transcriptional regulator